MSKKQPTSAATVTVDPVVIPANSNGAKAAPVVVQRNTGILATIDAAIEKGCDAEQLGKLLDVYERYQRNEALRAYQEAMCACQAEIPLVLTDAENKHTKSRYRTLGTLIHKIKPIITKHGFSLSFHQGDMQTPREGWVRIVCDSMHKAGHREVKFLDLPIDGQGAKGGATAMNGNQGVGSTTSYGERYLTCKIFLVPIADDDLDGNLPTDLIDEDQIAEINDLLEKGWFLLPKNKEHLDRFMRWVSAKVRAEVKSVGDIPKDHYAACVEHLRGILTKGGQQ
jgi:hypothetical protein